jgi:hypothetical protein
MFKRVLTPLAILSTLAFAYVLVPPETGVVNAATECKSDSDCEKGMFCILAETPHVCKPPQAAGAKCVRDVVCASGKCDMSKGKPGACQ